MAQGAFNGSGSFVLGQNFVTEAASPPIEISKLKDEFDGIATGLSTCLARDGQSTVSANIPFNDKKITGLGNATADADALNRVTADARYLKLLLTAFCAQRTTNVTLTESAVATLVFDEETADVGSGYDNATGIFTAPATGIYQFSSTVVLINNASGSATLNSVWLSHNDAGAGSVPGCYRFSGMTLAGTINAGSNNFTLGVSVTLSLTASDTVRIKLDLGAVGGSGSMAFQGSSHFSGSRVG